jgi:hypothetical protein
MCAQMFLVHPKDEPLDKLFQGNRSSYRAAYDAQRRQGLAGPEKVALETAARKASNEAAARRRREEQGLDPDEPESQPVARGARYCESVCPYCTAVCTATPADVLSSH